MSLNDGFMTEDGRTIPSSLSELRSEPVLKSVRPWQLDDSDWLQARYRSMSDLEIARELGCSEATVRRARQALGITSFRVGRRSRDTTPKPQAVMLAGSLVAGVQRFREDSQRRTPPTRELLIARCRAWLDAEEHHDQLAIEDALLAIASAAMLVHQHQAELRRVA